MEVRTIAELIDWSKQLHHHLAQRLAQDAVKHQVEMARFLLDYLAMHEQQIEKMVQAFEQQADPKILHTYIYDYLSHKPITLHCTGEKRYTELNIEQICDEVFAYHQQIIELCRDLVNKTELPEPKAMLASLLSMEQHEVMRLAQQTGRMYDI
jgi:sulfur relay (sulfurtransferase) DsrC/TusE family protein